MPLNNRGFDIIRLADASAEVCDSFVDLPADPYCPDRCRRFSQYRVSHRAGRWGMEVLPHGPLIQPERFNSYVGGVLRYLEPMKVDVSYYVATVAEQVLLDPEMDWHFDVHQWRTACHAEADSISVPEGPHQDGHEFGAIVIVSRQNVVGGLTTLYSLTDRSPFFETTLGPSEALIFDDRRMLHFTSNVRASGRDGYRDIFVFNINSWYNRKYGFDFERNSVRQLPGMPP